jgi:hypothetical protein
VTGGAFILQISHISSLLYYGAIKLYSSLELQSVTDKGIDGNSRMRLPKHSSRTVLPLTPSMANPLSAVVANNWKSAICD